MIESQPDPTSFGLGIDAGGTETRWALAAPGGSILADGRAAGLSALQMGTPQGRDAVRATFAHIATGVLVHGVPGRVQAGLTGFGGDSELLQRWLAEALHIDPQHIHFCSDMEIAYRASFVPGEGYLVYAGTGSIGAYVDAHGQFHRAGGRGVILDDGGGGFWIAREALRQELARLALALTARFGPRPVAVSGRAAELHPMIIEAMRAALPGMSLTQAPGQAHYAAARMALVSDLLDNPTTPT
ncbi:MAG: ATPase [Massilia sp.]|nr:ATPase [Massilia sp.]